MQLLIINAGSSSVRFALFYASDAPPVLISKARYDHSEIDAAQALRTFTELRQITRPLTVIHRFVHGGEQFSEPVLLTPKIITQLRKLAPLAPLHTPQALKLIKAVAQHFNSKVKQIAVFDTAFFRDLPTVAKTYALPATLSQQHQLYRYGFHGFAHHYMWQRWQTLTGNHKTKARLITLQLGAGCSISAIRDGKAQDTSMGFTPLEGLVMGTRCGDIDPGLLLFLQRRQRYSIAQLEKLLYEHSGLLGLSGESADMRQLINSSSDAARLAINVFCYRARKYIGSYLAALGGADAIVFGGGIGENIPQIRKLILDNLSWCGIRLDHAANQICRGQEGRISTSDSNIHIWSIKVDEEQLIAETAYQVLPS